MIGALEALHGNLAARTMLDRLLARRRLPHALLFAGPDGVGKRAVALALARGLDCERDVAADCPCGPCGKIARGVHPDVRTIAPEGQFLKIDQVRGLLDLVRLRPYEGNAKLFIVDGADAMNEESGNALLKTLEEPPPDTYLVLVTARPDALLPTIRSRCRTIRFQPLARAEVAGTLVAQGVPAAEAERRALFSAGSVGTAMALDLPATEGRRARALAILEVLASGPAVADLWQVAKRESAERGELEALLEVIKELARDLALLQRGGDLATLAHPDIAGPLGKIGARVPPGSTLELFKETEVLRTAIRGNAVRLMALEVMLLRARTLFASPAA